MKKLFLSFIVLLSSNAFSAEVWTTLQPAQISVIQMHTTQNVEARSQNTAILATSHLQAPCSKGVYIDVIKDSATYSTALSAYVSGKTIKLLYNTSKPSPWGDPAWCAVSALGFSN